MHVVINPIDVFFTISNHFFSKNVLVMYALNSLAEVMKHEGDALQYSKLIYLAAAKIYGYLGLHSNTKTA